MSKLGDVITHDIMHIIYSYSCIIMGEIYDKIEKTIVFTKNLMGGIK